MKSDIDFQKKYYNPVLVYQMGKVASETIYYSLKKVSGINVFHIHRLNPENILKVKEEHLKRGDAAPNEEENLYLYENVIKSPKVSIKIITLIREPISRNISAYFQNLKSFEGMSDAYNILEVEKLISSFIEKYNHIVPLEWFNIELYPTTGINIYKYNFPKNLGYQVIEEAPYHLLIMKHDLDDKIKERCIEDFLGIDSFSISNFNEASKKNYAEAYGNFLDSIKLSNQYINKMLSSQYARHFYSENELKKISERWQKI
ncbi:MAG: hypothetical protein GY694_12685 [Gammaproteobacteria bacterium]|nr:hypothetical protein [Gammaproteobacteria bacterium]